MKRRALAVTAAIATGLAGYVGWRARGTRRLRSALWCRLGILRHELVRERTAVGPVYRCTRCRKADVNLLAFLDPKAEDGFVDVVRPDQQARLHGWTDLPVTRGRFLRGSGMRRRA